MIFIQFKEARKLTKGVVTFIYCVCGLISLVIFSLMQIGSTSTPLANVENNGGPEKLAKYGIEERLFGILIVFFLFLGSLNISLVWLELSERIRNLSMRSASSKKYQRIIYLFEVGFAAVVIVSVSTGQFIISSLIAFPYVFLLLYIYKRGHGGFREILMTADAAGDSKNTTYLQLAKLVQRTAVIVAVCLGIYFITSLAFSLMLFIEWRQFSPIGGVSYVVLTLQITNIVASIWLGQIFWYSHVNIQQMQKQLSSKDKEAITSEPGNTKPTGLASAKVGFEETHDASTDHSHSI
uniref:Uncharacterized protein n=1 Tax=Aplanochytrium stocchinoi TaxID=215587 RepID=A0A7S3PF53_9STRA